MSNNLTGKLNDSLEGKLDRLITVVQSTDARLEGLATELDEFESPHLCQRDLEDIRIDKLSTP